jgi:hypothetical protein
MEWISGGINLAGINGQQTSYFAPADSTEWEEFSTNISVPSLTENFRIMFEFKGDGGNNIYIDNVLIEGVHLAVPILVSPLNYADQQPLDVTLDWNAIDASVPFVDFYDYEIDTASSFNSSFLIGGSNGFIDHSNNGTDTQYQLMDLDSVTTVFWRVRTRTGADTSIWSSVWQFSTLEQIIGVNENNQLDPGIIVYPNPAINHATLLVEIESPCQHFGVRAYDYLGREIKGILGPFETVLPKGEHYLKINCDKFSGLLFLKVTVDGNPFFTNLVIIE